MAEDRQTIWLTQGAFDKLGQELDFLKTEVAPRSRRSHPPAPG